MAIENRQPDQGVVVYSDNGNGQCISWAFTGTALASGARVLDGIHRGQFQFQRLGPTMLTSNGTLLEAWASHKSFKPKDGPPSEPPAGRNAEVAWHGQKRSNETHQSTTDPEARLARKSFATAAKMSYAGHLLMENRNALIVDAELTAATGHAERDCAVEMLARLPASKRRRTIAADKAYDTRDFIAKTRGLGFTPHVAQNTTNRRSAIDARTTRHRGHIVWQRIRKRVEEPFGCIKTIGGGRKLRYIGRQRNRAWFKIEAAVYNLIRITALDTAAA